MKIFQNTKPKVLVCALTGVERQNWINPELLLTLIAMSKDPRFDVNFFPLKDCRPVEHARNITVDVAKQMGADWLISFDNDNFPKGNALDVIASAADDKRVIGLTYGVYYAEGIRPFPHEEMQGARDSNFREVLHVGGGCLMIHKSVWQKIAAPYFRFVLPSDYDGDSAHKQKPNVIGEDVWFCNLVRKHGFKVWTHNTVFAGHYHTADLTGLVHAFAESRR